LVVEDEKKVASFIAKGLQEEGHAVDVLHDGESGAMQALRVDYDLVVLDLMLPKRSGLEVLRAIRVEKTRLPVLILTAKGELEDRVSGLDAGADDYLVKPFDLDELGARIRAVIRRHSGRAQPALAYGSVRLDPATRQVTRDGLPVVLSAREFAVLEALLQRPGAVLSRAQLEDRLYGWGEEIESNAVSVYIHQLRRKLGAELIQNVRGVGYYVGDKPGGG
jgi:DNA-binding response OmpR family regulator